jgi:hypothetical protein
MISSTQNPQTNFRAVEAQPIMLLGANAGPKQEEVSCKLVEPELNSSLKYEALSYVWDQLPETKHIICNDTPFPVTGNLHAALRRLRRPNESRVLWIDQICP